MDVDPHDPPRAAGAVATRRLCAGDLAAAHALSASLGWPHRIADWQAMLALGQGLAVADAAGRLVGTALWWEHGPGAATLGMILVEPDMQRRGIGRALMRELLAATDDRRHRLYSTGSGLGLYAQHGFRPVRRLHQHQGNCQGAVGSSRVRPASALDRDRIIALETRSFGAGRQHVMERLQALGATAVIATHGRIGGYALRRRFGRGNLIGPVVAESEADALALVAASLEPGFNRVDVASDSKVVAATLRRLGMAAVDTVEQMDRGDWPTPPEGLHRLAPASQALG